MKELDQILTYSNAVLVVFAIVIITLIIMLISKNAALQKIKDDTQKTLIDAAAATAQNSQLLSLKDEHEKTIDSLNGDVIALSTDNARLNTSLLSVSQNIEKLTLENSALKEDQKVSDDIITSLKAQIASLNGKIEAKDLNIEDIKAQHEISFKELEQRLINISGQLIRSGSDNLGKMSIENLSGVVKPLKEQLEGFKQYLSDTQEKDATRQGMLRENLEQMVKAQTSLSKEANSLARALTDGGKSQGMWGELQLERVLGSCGLTNGIEYKREVAGVNAHQDKIRPDAVINLPDGHCLIIDAKCSLTAYTQYVNSTDEQNSNEALKSHLKSVRDHVEELYRKDYFTLEGLNSPDFVFMFVPVDGALSCALYEDAALYQDAARKKVFLVSPSSIIPALRVVSNLWVLSEQSERLKELANISFGIAKKFENVLESLDDVITVSHRLDEKILNLDSRLRSGKDNLMVKLDRFRLKAQKEFAIEEISTIEQESVTLTADKT